VGRFIDSAANAMNGNGDKLRETITQLSGVGRILADGSGNIVDIIKNLQIFVTALRDSNTQIVQFQDRLATVSSVVDASRSDLDHALTNLSEAVGETKRFIAGSRNQTAEQIQRLANATGNLADNGMALKNALHVAPNAIGNGYNIYNPDTGSMLGAFAMANFSNPLQVICSAIGAVQNATAPETSKLCAQYLGPALRLLNFNYMPMPFNAYLAKSPSPENLIYSDPKLAPGGTGGSSVPPEIPPSVSAYTGADDVPPPPGWATPPGPPGAYAPHGLPADPSPAVYPGAPIPPGVPSAPAPRPTTLQDMLLPAEALPMASAPQPSEGAPPS
jgi:phospholipid/cholesterol/gamma-HCH transport system substrate-binding protein